MREASFKSPPNLVTVGTCCFGVWLTAAVGCVDRFPSRGSGLPLFAHIVLGLGPKPYSPNLSCLPREGSAMLPIARSWRLELGNPKP